MNASRPLPVPAPQVLDREFLEMRARLLELAASFDRLERGAGSVEGDSRLSALRRGLEILREGESDRAEQIQMLFSRPYDSNWREQFSGSGGR